MRISKPLNPGQLVQELEAASAMPPGGLMLSGIYPDTEYDQDIWTKDDEGEQADLEPDAQAVVLAHDWTKQSRTVTFEDAEDEERLALVNERASEDPAFAALVELTLGRP